MKVEEILYEAKARIQHPEDRIFDDGSTGVKNALTSLLDAATTSKNISLKFDGSPALIAGMVNNKFVMTDKAGLAKFEFPTSPDEIDRMLFIRKPNDVGRSEYAQHVASLFKPIRKLIPLNFKGLIQFDVMWFSRPPLENGVFQIKPNKVLYQIPANSYLGMEIAESNYGIVVHSYFDSPEDDEPRAIANFNALGLNQVKGLVVLNPKVTFEMKPNSTLIKNIHDGLNYINRYSAQIDTFINQPKLAANKISDLLLLMKKFLAYRARNGMHVSIACIDDFITWLNDLDINTEKKNRMLQYIKENDKEYRQIWTIDVFVVNIKNELIKLLGNQQQDIQASIDDQPSHEGFVIDAPSGKIKLVNRPLFMRK